MRAALELTASGLFLAAMVCTLIGVLFEAFLGGALVLFVTAVVLVGAARIVRR